MTERHEAGYKELIDKVKQKIAEGGKVSRENISHWLDNSRSFSKAAKDLTQDELELLRSYAKRDLQSLMDTYSQAWESSPWANSLTNSFWHGVLEMTDRTQLEWTEVAEDIQHQGRYFAGEWVGFGVLRCESCGHTQRIEHPRALTGCIQCGHDQFRREPFEP